jgi:hypothetical protein
VKRFIAIAWLVCMAVSGCSMLADTLSLNGTDSSKVYDKPYDVVWNALVETVRASGLRLVSENKEGGTMLAQGAISTYSLGEDVTIYVQDLGAKVKTRVEVVSKRAVTANVTAANWDTRILQALDKRFNSLSAQQSNSGSSAVSPAAAGLP